MQNQEQNYNDKRRQNDLSLIRQIQFKKKKKTKEYAHRKQGQYKKYGNKMSMKKNHLVIMNV